jgi:hypothetical protein
MPSAPEKETETGRLYQPFESGGREGVPPDTEGAVESYRNEAVAASTFPALSVQEPFTEALLVSGPEYVLSGVQKAIPDASSVPPNEIPTGLSYQPFASGPRPSVAVVTGGAES